MSNPSFPSREGNTLPSSNQSLLSSDFFLVFENSQIKNVRIGSSFKVYKNTPKKSIYNKRRFDRRHHLASIVPGPHHHMVVSEHRTNDDAPIPRFLAEKGWRHQNPTGFR